MSPTIDATLTAIGTDLYTPVMEGAGESERNANLRPEHSNALDSLARNKADIDRNVLVPILESTDIFATFADKREAYKDWRNAWVSAFADNVTDNDVDMETVMAMQDAQDNQLKSIFTGSQERLGEPAVRALLGAIGLNKVVRNSTMPHSESWPEESWHEIAHLFTSSELCMIGVLHHLATGIGRNENVRMLADWSFIYADNAYSEAGYFGPEAGRLEGKK